MALASSHRRRRYSRPLQEGSNDLAAIPASWEQIRPVPHSENDPRYMRILRKYGFEDTEPLVPLRSRYTRGRPWTQQEFAACFAAWDSGSSLTLISAALNRNPQDIIYRLLDYCQEHGIAFTERGRSEGSTNWTSKVTECAARLFSEGLPAWKIATLFRVDFEYVEKQLFGGRDDYGHNKRNPFTINTRHKHLVNRQVLINSRFQVSDAFDAFAGEGITTEIVHGVFPQARIIAVESDPQAFAAAKNRHWSQCVKWELADNLDVMRRLLKSGDKFNLADLDPFVTCHQQLHLVWELLRPSSLLFVTFGGEYRRSFIKGNRKAIALRYGFYDASLGNSEYLEIVPFFFLGWVAHIATVHGFAFSVIRAVRYANNCRFWLRVYACKGASADHWFDDHVVTEAGGYRFRDLYLPRFSQVRDELRVSESQARISA